MSQNKPPALFVVLCANGSYHSCYIDEFSATGVLDYLARATGCGPHVVARYEIQEYLTRYVPKVERVDVDSIIKKFLELPSYIQIKVVHSLNIMTPPEAWNMPRLEFYFEVFKIIKERAVFSKFAKEVDEVYDDWKLRDEKAGAQP